MTESLRGALGFAGYGLVAVLSGFGGAGLRAWAARRLLGREPFAERAGVGGRALHLVLSVVVGLVAWFVLFLICIALVRGIAYPSVGGGDYENSWGGPTLAGAWAVHALLAIAVVLPIGTLLIAALGVLQFAFARRLLVRAGAWWPLPVAVLVTMAGALFFVAWTHQA
ncbi:hypothetical protein NDR87_16780 [Nocardia sp. CDC159]|uniref:Uncharacterized protein n=1 Tax=Nocardia pulmonis TaxID=2951408 RepID=A0A9X2E7Z3_9NOCA|nr:MULTISPECIES: hypothetical protein [Nocardia]MCM6775250.1 hypothetical protein [Nocardia pulmonis]MCM6788016.1 hypothetical protein [Nocardia sp. CDC159]